MKLTEEFAKKVMQVILIISLSLLAGFFLTQIIKGPEIEKSGVQYGDKVCVNGAGWFMGNMPRPQGFLVCGFLEEFEPELGPPEEERSLGGL